MLPEIFKIGSISISGYSFFYILGILAYSLMFIFLAQRENLDVIESLNFIIFGVISAVLGAKLYGVVYVILKNPAENALNIDLLWQEFKTGGVFYGGVIAGLVFAYFYLRKYFKGNEWRVADITVIGVALGHVLGRIGCFCAGCCYGRPTDLPWGIKFPFLSNDLHPCRDVFVHPTQIYEALLNLVNFIVLFLFWRRRKFTGQIFSMYLINYGIIRFFGEMLRNDGGRGYLFKVGDLALIFSYPQLISIILIGSGTVIYFKLKKRASQ